MEIVKKILSIFIIIVFFAFNTNAQKRTLKVVDATTGETIPFANVCLEAVDIGDDYYYITDNNGEVILEANGEFDLAVSFIGYKTHRCKVNTSDKLLIKLKADIFALEQVVITGQYRPILKDSSIYAISVIDANLIERRGAVDLGSALKSQPSIKISQDGVSGANINILGLGGENIKIMIDGVPIIGRICGNIDLAQISMSNVKHIEIIEGPMSVVYGSNALAGTVNIITKNNKWNSNLLTFKTHVESYGRLNSNLFGSIKRGGHMVSGSLARNFFDGKSVNSTDRRSKWKGRTQYTGDMSYAYTRKKVSFRTKVNYFTELMKSKGSIDGEGGPNPNATDVNHNTERYGLSTFLDFKHSSKKATNIQGSVSIYDRSLNTVRKNMSDLSETFLRGDTTSFVNYMARGVFSNRISNKMEYQVGLDFSSETGEAKRIAGKSQNISDYAVFITGKRSFWNVLTFQPGLRYAYNTKFKTPLLYSLNAKLQITDNIKFRSSFAKGFRAPTLKEMYLDFFHASYNIKGNRNLDPESSHTFNSVLEYSKQNGNKSFFKIEGKAYYNKIKNRIGFDMVSKDTLSGIETWQNINRGFIETIGGIANVDYKLNNTWAFNVNYAYSGITSLLYLRDNSKSKFHFSSKILTSVEYKLPKYNFYTRIEHVYNGKEGARYIDEVSGKEPIVDDYHDLNLTVSKAFFKRRLNVSMGAKNLLNNTDLAVRGTSSGNSSGGHSSTTQYRLMSLGTSYFLTVNLKLSKN